jgi:PAS domain S-box-containing protein
MTIFLEHNADYLAFIFGLSLASIAALCFSLCGRDRRLPWLWLGLFTLTQAGVEWLALSAQEAGDALAFRLLRPCLLIVSCALFAEFDRRSWRTVHGRGPGRWVLLPLVAGLGYLGWRGPAVLDLAATRYLIPAEALLAAALFWQAARRDWAENGRWLVLPAVSCAGNALNLVALRAAGPLHGVPAPPSGVVSLLGALLTGVAVVGLTAYWESLWSRRRDLRYVRSRTRMSVGIGLGLACVLGLGWVATDQLGRREETEARESVLMRTASVAAALPLKRVEAMARATDATGTPDYDFLRSQLRRIRQLNTDCCRLYLVGRRGDRVVFLVDAEPEDSPDFSPFGKPDPGASPELRRLFDGGAALVERPNRDSRGLWSSALAPVTDLETGRVEAVLRMDVDPTLTLAEMSRARHLGISIAAVAYVLVIVIFLSMQRFADFAAQVNDSERRYRALFDSSPDALIQLDDEGQVLGVNRYGLETMGRSAAEATGRPFPDLFCLPAQPRAREALAQVRAGGFAHFDAECPNAEGALVAWHVMLRPIVDEVGEIRRLVAICLDITERKRAEETLRATNQRLTAVNEIARALASTLDQESVMRIVLQEVRRVVPYDRASLVMCDASGRRGQFVAVTGAPELSQALSPLGFELDLNDLGLDQVIEQGQAMYQSDLRLAHAPLLQKLAEAGVLSAVCVPIVSDYVTLGCLNVTRREADAFSEEERELLQSLTPHIGAALNNARAYEQLRAARLDLQKAQEQMLNIERLRSIGEVAGGVAHDFNNLLGVILNRTQILLETVDDPGACESLRLIETATRDGRDTVKRIQSFVGRQSEDAMMVVNLDDLVTEALQLTDYRWKNEAEREGLTITTEALLGAAPLVRVNPAEIREVLINLIVNACDAMPDGGRITVRTYVQAGRAALEVADTGTGMDEETSAHIFDLFFTTKGAGNTGLGLAISDGIIQRHGGKIAVCSDPGQGTMFTVTLPLTTETIEEETTMTSTPPAESLQVLVVDDDPMVREALQAALSVIGYPAVGAPNGFDAVNLVKQQPFDVVVTDLGMPGMSGWKVAEEVKRLSPRTQVLILTGWGDTIEPTRFVDETLSKPLELSVLREVMARAVERKAA